MSWKISSMTIFAKLTGVKWKGRIGATVPALKKCGLFYDRFDAFKDFIGVPPMSIRENPPMVRTGALRSWETE